MPITIHLVRHAQGFHNLNYENQQIPDPYLTPLGHEQCAQLCTTFPYHDRITHLVASPLRRTLVTCYESFQPAVKSGKKVIAQPLLQETSSHPCDTGSEPEVIRAEYGAWADCDLVEKGWNDKTSPGSKWAPRVDALEERARETRVWLRELARKSGGDAEIAVVTHGGFLHFLTQDWDGMDLSRGTCLAISCLWPRGCEVHVRIAAALGLEVMAKGNVFWAISTSADHIIHNRDGMGQYRVQIVPVHQPRRGRSAGKHSRDESELAEKTRQRDPVDRDGTATGACRCGG